VSIALFTEAISMDKNIKKILSQLTLKEKASLCSGLDNWRTKPVKRLGIPSIRLADGPHGLRVEAGGGDDMGGAKSLPATCFPTAAALACCWDRELLAEIGGVLAEECLEQGVSVLLGPGANLKRSPLCGRNFEYFSEDPLLSGEMAAAWIEGVQGKGVGASLKHFAANNQEHRRMTINAVVDDRALRELYLASFERAIRGAKPLTVMCAYNRLNGEFCSENEWLLSKVLREEWGFGGAVVTDWGACNDRAKGLASGQDLEMPSSGGVNDKLILKAVQDGKLDEAALDRTVERLLRLIFAGAENARPGFRCDMGAHHTLARRAAAESAVLLKNNGGLLPLKGNARIAVIGAFAKSPRYQGSGSSRIHPARLESAWDEMLKYAPECVYAPGYRLDTDMPDETLIMQACLAVKGCDAVVVFAGLPEEYEAEGFDREHMRMPESHNALILRVAEATPRTAVVLMGGAPVEMPWIGSVAAVLDSYLGGEAGGGGIADVLFGAVNPSGKLAETLPVKLEDTLSSKYFPSGPRTVEYRESIYIGYRWFEKAGLPVHYPFGHGLSYTAFEYSGMAVGKMRLRCDEGLEVSLQVRNTGDLPGAEVVQLYVRDMESTVFRPEKELKGFEKVWLAPGEEKQITFALDRRAFAYWNTAISAWHVESGEFELLAGASSADIRLRETVRVDSDKPDAPLPDFRETAPAYYDAEKAKQGIGDAEFRVLYGCELPQAGRLPKEKFTMTDALDDTRTTLMGKALYRLVRLVAKRVVGVGNGPLGRKMAERFAGDLLLRNLISMSNGLISRKTMNGILWLMNRGNRG
jgi:beta-glucosidase